MLYSAEIFVNTLKVEKYCKKIILNQRLGALQVVYAYRTVSKSADLVVASLPNWPIGDRKEKDLKT